METFSPPQPAIDLAPPLYYQLVHTLTALLPPPIDDTLEALHTRNHAAIAKVAALLPVNANEADLAAHCIAARAQAEDLLRLLRQHAGDINLVMRLNAQYGSMVRTSLSVHARLMRVQALRQKREQIEGAANQDARTLHMAERSMLAVADPDAGTRAAASPEGPWATSPEATPAADVDQTTEEHVAENETNSHDAGFETWLSALFPGRPGRPDETWLLEAALEPTTPEPPSPGRELPANRPESRAPADHACHIHAETAST